MPDYQLSDIEDFFNSQRAKVRWPFKRLDPLDWAMMDAWQKDGVPFGVICRGIEEVITNHVRRSAQGRVNTVRYCEQVIKRHWKDHVAAHVGSQGGEAATGHQAEFGVERILEALQVWIDCLQHVANRFSHDSTSTFLATAVTACAFDLSRLRAGLPQEPDYEKLDAQLAEIETHLMAAIRDHAGLSRTHELTLEAKKEFAKYRDLWMPELWAEQINKFIEKKLREEYELPRLSLFYL